ncbi:unnamed protein product [Cylindrotheca closterium]|uniref:Uncharacterized protein n=1 Tax=Cylindrotheca closterium TaxID=2856 RepID=A0AAD2JIU5_9STRA|nr:unnamed protein product [Cylindrotheca closterium]
MNTNKAMKIFVMKKIDQDEIDALLEEAEEFIENYDDEHTKNVEEQTEDRSVASIYERLRRRNDDENSNQDPNPNDKYQNDENLNEQIQEIEEDIQKDKEDVESLNDEEQIKETRKTYEENDDLIDQIQDEIKECENQVNDVRKFVANLDDNENKNDESDNNLDESSDNDNYKNDEVNKQDIFSARKTRSVHPDFRSNTGGVLTMGEGGLQIILKKQKLNSRSSTEAKLIGVNDAATQILWTKLFVEAQGYPIEGNILYQDIKSSFLLEKNGLDSAGKRSGALNI